MVLPVVAARTTELADTALGASARRGEADATTRPAPSSREMVVPARAPSQPLEMAYTMAGVYADTSSGVGVGVMGDIATTNSR